MIYDIQGRWILNEDMLFESLHTDRLVLRAVTPHVYAFVFNHYSNEELKEFFGHQTADELSKERSRFQKGMTTFNKSFLFFHIIEKVSNKVIGWCGYHTWYLDHRRAEIGYVLYHDVHMGKGLMSEAVRRIIRYGFENMNLNRIEAFAGPGNTASLNILKRAGFVWEGHMRSHFYKNEVMEDSVIYALLKTEFDPGK